ncbi:short-chain dehydrogenase/reductase-like protein [Tricladium varicosporioides]|nr:short-chain dehydrogenase/reductase-like protein [Hymenoscyphus varicosporioides]
MEKITLPTVLITGCTTGSIGHSLALAFARQNYHVIATSRSISSMSSLSSYPNITLLPLNIASTSSITAIFKTVYELTKGRLDILYHNAGVRTIRMAIHSDYALAEKTFAANFFGIVEMNRVFMPLLLESKGKIVFSNSVAAVVPIPTTVLYGSSKAALDYYIRVLDEEVRPLGIKVVNIMTGEVGTGMAEQKLDELPEGSPYESIRRVIDEAWMARGNVMPVTEYAEGVVGKVVKKNLPTRIWYGGNATMVWFVETLGIQWVYKRMFRKEYGLDRLGAMG